MIYVIIILILLLLLIFLFCYNKNEGVWYKKVTNKLKGGEQNKQILYVVGPNNYIHNFMMKVNRDATIRVIRDAKFLQGDPTTVFDWLITKDGTGALHVGAEDKTIYGATFYIWSDVDVTVTTSMRGYLA